MKKHEKRTCRAVTAEGEHCTNTARAGSKYCWQHPDSPTAFWPQSLLLSTIFLVLGFLLAVAYDKHKTSSHLKDQRALQEQLAPRPVVEIQQVADTELKVTVASTNLQSAVVDNLFFSLDIPGTFVAVKSKDFHNLAGMSADSAFRYSTGGIIAMETLNIGLNKLYPGGGGTFRILFTPPGSETYQAGGMTYTNTPAFSDLRDYIWVQHFWNVEGTQFKDRFPLSLRHLPIVKEDNKALIRTFRQEEFHRRTGTPLRPHEERWTDDYQHKKELERAGLTEDTQPDK